MKKLFVFIAALAFSIAIMAQTPARVEQKPAVKADTEKTCAEWQAEGKCTRVADGANCTTQREAGKCPKHNAAEAAKKATAGKSCANTGCGGCQNKKAEEPKKVEEPKQQKRRR
jgi:hypothetical protein